jgi:hypothetical protein
MSAGRQISNAEAGLIISLAVGAAVDDAFREICFVRHPAHPIIVNDFSSDIEAIIKQVWAKARKAKNVNKYLKKS